MTTSIETYTGKFFDFANPRAEDVDVRDIARALSMTVRFGGHVSRFYSVAEHACKVSDLIEDSSHKELAYAALHHDSHEAYIGDIPSPLKSVLGLGYKDLAARIDNEIRLALHVNQPFNHVSIKECDIFALRIEAGKLKESKGVGEHWGHEEDVFGHCYFWTPAEAEQKFLDRHYRLRRELGLD